MADQENDVVGENSDDSSNPQNMDQNDDTKEILSPDESTNNKATTTTPRRGNTNIVSLSSYKSDNHNTEGQAYYAGGSVNSGQQIIGPDKKSKNPTEKLFEAAKKHGATVVSEQSTSSEKSEKNTFCGAGYKLGSDVEPSEQVSPSLLSQREHNTLPPAVCVIKIWSNGFSIDSGPLRDFNEPSNKMFLATISKGEVPLELRRHARNAVVNITMEDHHEEEYVKPKVTLKAFSGKGQMLGSPCPPIFQDAYKPSPINLQGASSTPSPPENLQNSAFQVDESKPVTSIQIRLANGTRLVTKFNHDSTIGDIRNVVRNARPDTGNFNLMTTFPNKILTDDNVSIVDAKLLNAVIVQRLSKVM